MVLKSQQTPLSGAGIFTMAPKTSGIGRHSEPGGNKHHGMAQGIEDPASSNQIMSSMSYEICVTMGTLSTIFLLYHYIAGEI